LELLREQLRTDDRDCGPESLLFVNSNGQPIVTDEVDEDGKVRNVDNIKSAYWRVLQKLKIPKDERRSLGSIRTTSGSMIRHKFGRELQTLFLGNKFHDVASKHYTTSRDDFRLDEPLKWLAGQYGFASEAKPKPKRTTKRKRKA
jgi:hypothetical protein